MTAFFSAIEKHPLIAILRGIKPTEVVDVAEILIEKDFKIIEIPLNSPDPIRSIELLTHYFENHAIIGAGTVLDEASIRSIAEAGAKLVVMPNGNGIVVKAAKDRGLIAIPGIATPSEAFAMIEAGADALKLFPAEGIPPSVLKAMKAVLPSTVPILPVGGITPEKMNDYLKAGAIGFGLGSALYKPGMTLRDIRKNAEAFNQALTFSLQINEI
ncbi:MAG: 2-dehydro-3-deoxy-6-phosphogalactonate aldolase [Thalassobaculaceae bacterium]|jgi:2-dehydro-3-deoxyphosphogalactonate aldolase|tara:strand:+ start:4898 stop:5539 length:642 start_codon:yes stop_codon:yes gene_type:complete